MMNLGCVFTVRKVQEQGQGQEVGEFWKKGSDCHRCLFNFSSCRILCLTLNLNYVSPAPAPGGCKVTVSCRILHLLLPLPPV
jgi:hypothetical protein